MAAVVPQDDNKQESATNTCVICLEALSTAHFGAAVPCGHCFHVHCFEGWRHSRQGCASGHSPVKCPTCNKTTSSFCRLFLDVMAMEVECLSISSGESSSDELYDDDGEDEMDSDDDDGERRKASCRKQTTYKKAAKLLQSKVEKLEAQRETLYDERESLVNSREDALAQLEEADGTVESLQAKMEKQCRELEGVSYGIVVAQRERDETKRKLEAAIQEKARAEVELKECIRRFAREVEKVEAKSMKEVQTLLAEHPKLSEENKLQKEEIKDLKRTVAELTSRLSSPRARLEPAVEEESMALPKERHIRDDAKRQKRSTETSASRPQMEGSTRAAVRKLPKGKETELESRKRRRKELAKQMQRAAERNASLRQMNGIVSIQAARMSRASAKETVRRSGLSVLNHVDANRKALDRHNRHRAIRAPLKRSSDRQLTSIRANNSGRQEISNFFQSKRAS